MNLYDVLRDAGEIDEALGDAARAALDGATHITEDSRRAGPGSIFVAVAGTHGDGHLYSTHAIHSGAIAVMGERTGQLELDGAPYITVKHARRAAALCAHALHDNPAAGMVNIGVTGTNGKSSTVALIDSILRHAGHRTCLFGTLGYVVAGEKHEAPHTTPFGEELAALFGEAATQNCTHSVMEVSSHALHQHRVAGIPFSVAAFTNLTQDHLDYHHTMDDYRDAKAMLFASLDPDSGIATVNVDDPHGEFYAGVSKARCIRYGDKGDVRAENIRATIKRTSFDLVTPWGRAAVALPLLGKHNVANALCAAAVTGALDIPLAAIVQGLEALPNVPGRFEPVTTTEPFQVVVDYAHTDDGLRNVLEAARQLCDGKIITVFGCGGDRDKTKRPRMGKVAGQLSDYCILTSDNPRTEDPFRILLDAEVGLQQAGRRKGEHYDVIEDRLTAIDTAIRRARPGDLVMIAGKGHEDYQILGTEKIHFDDREVARAILSGMRK